MFHYQEKLKDLKVEYIQNEGDDSHGVFKVNYKNESVSVYIQDGTVTEAVLGYGKNKSDIIQLIKTKMIVRGNWNEMRGVYHFSTPDGILPTLRCGYTVHSGAGTWSSTPHPFELEPEKGFEEVFLYLLRVGDPIWEIGRAIQVGNGMWQDGEKIEEIWRIYDRDISAIPMGYHPVVGEPGVHVSYIWAYLAKHKNWEKI